MIISKTPYRISLFGGGTDFPNYFKKYKFSLIYLDMDLYKPTKISLEVLSKNLVKNGLIVFDIYVYKYKY